MSVIDIPVLFVIGDAGIVSFETARELQILNPNVRLEVIQDAGHGVQYNPPERVEAAILSFLHSVVTSSTSR